jgi:hypothetical protein
MPNRKAPFMAYLQLFMATGRIGSRPRTTCYSDNSLLDKFETAHWIKKSTNVDA